MSMSMQEVIGGLQFPEGPVAMADGSVVLVEMRRKTASTSAVGHGPDYAYPSTHEGRMKLKLAAEVLLRKLGR